jgi:hypothetical protein
MTLPTLPQASKAIGRAALALGLMAFGVGVWRQAHPSLPAEYQALEAVMRRLAAHNQLGSSPIGFSINNGTYASTLAEMRGFCKAEACTFFGQLNPYKSYGRDWDEISRQSYTLGDIGAWSTSSGTIEVPRASFRIYGRHSGWLACTVAHEIAHIRRNHIFLASYYANNTIQKIPKEKQEELNYAKSREQELEADRDAALMMRRSGYKGRICVDDLVFLHKSSGNGSATEPDSSHPGYDERIKMLTAFYEQLEKNKPARESGTQGRFTYNPADNLFSFIPSVQ